MLQRFLVEIQRYPQEFDCFKSFGYEELPSLGHFPSFRGDLHDQDVCPDTGVQSSFSYKVGETDTTLPTSPSRHLCQKPRPSRSLVTNR